MIDAQSALAWGLVDYVGEISELQERLRCFAADVATCSATAIAETKRIIQTPYAEAVDSAIAAEAEASARAIASPDARHRISSFLARRQK
jgi:enoyl-CoA hydratase/carnithine racemase